MQMARLGAMDLPTALALLGGTAVCYAAWLTSIVLCRLWCTAIADRGGDLLPDRDRPWCRHLVRRLVSACSPPPYQKALRARRQP
jgi:hypothetical protein